MDDLFDCIVIGGGPAGLLAATYLGRFCRKVCIIHDNNSRANLIPRSHNCPGYPDGIMGAELLNNLKTQAAKYIEGIFNFTVSQIENDPNSPDFFITTQDKVFKTKSILIATGIKDISHDIIDYQSAVRSGALRHCTICDGYEVKAQSTIVFGHDEHAVDIIKSLLIYSKKLHLVTGAKLLKIPDEAKVYLEQHNINIYDKPIRSITFTPENKTLVAWKDNTSLLADTSYLGMGMKANSGIAKTLGLRLNKHEQIFVNEDQSTSHVGIFAAGDVCNSLAQIATAFGSAAIAARAIQIYLK